MSATFVASVFTQQSVLTHYSVDYAVSNCLGHENWILCDTEQSNLPKIKLFTYS